MNSKVVLLTGGTSGIGYEALKLLSGPSFGGCHVIVGARSEDKARCVIQEVQDLQKAVFENPSISYAPLDLSSLESVKHCAEVVSARHPNGLDAIILNAGMADFMRREVIYTNDGFEEIYQTNFLSQVLLLRLLLPLLKKKKSPRCIFVSSSLHDPDKRHERSPNPDTSSYAGSRQSPKRVPDVNKDDVQLLSAYNGRLAYTNSKLFGTMLMYHLSRILNNEDVIRIQFHSLSPGFIPQTNLFRSAHVAVRLFLRVCLDCLLKPFTKATRTPAEGGLGIAKLVVDTLPRPQLYPWFISGAADTQGSGYYRLADDNSGMIACASSDISYHEGHAAWLFEHACMQLKDKGYTMPPHT